jgi:hypothetical protein
LPQQFAQERGTFCLVSVAKRSSTLQPRGRRQTEPTEHDSLR